MPYIAAKLKPRIKPRIGLKSGNGSVESSSTDVSTEALPSASESPDVPTGKHEDPSACSGSESLKHVDTAASVSVDNETNINTESNHETKTTSSECKGSALESEVTKDSIAVNHNPIKDDSVVGSNDTKSTIYVQNSATKSADSDSSLIQEIKHRPIKSTFLKRSEYKPTLKRLSRAAPVLNNNKLADSLAKPHNQIAEEIKPQLEKGLRQPLLTTTAIDSENKTVLNNSSEDHDICKSNNTAKPTQINKNNILNKKIPDSPPHTEKDSSQPLFKNQRHDISGVELLNKKSENTTKIVNETFVDVPDSKCVQNAASLLTTIKNSIHDSPEVRPKTLSSPTSPLKVSSNKITSSRPKIPDHKINSLKKPNLINKLNPNILRRHQTNRKPLIKKGDNEEALPYKPSAIVPAVLKVPAETQDVEHLSLEAAPPVEITTVDNPSSEAETPSNAIDSNSDENSIIADVGVDKCKSIDVENAEIDPKTGSEKIKIPTVKNKTNKCDKEDVKMLCAISAIDYLRRHDHALGDSILRRLITGNKMNSDVQLKTSMCSSCNPQTLRKCLVSLWYFEPEELHKMIKRYGERHKAPVNNVPGRPLFKPALGRQRAPTMTASTYGKMCYEVKEGLVKKYGHNTPELSKLRMLDLIFYNPTENPMSDSKEGEQKKDDEKKSVDVGDQPSTSSVSKVSNSQTDEHNEAPLKKQPAVDDSLDSDPDDPSEVDSGSASANQSIPVPQVKIGDEGQIILAPESLVLKRDEPDISKNPLVQEYDFTKQLRKKHSVNRTSWSFEETLKFYKALHKMGTDFSTMLDMFPERTRKNLKSKFKREEKKNCALIDKVLGAQGQHLCLADIEKDLAADKTLRRLCIEVSSNKYPAGSVGSCLGLSQKKHKNAYKELMDAVGNEKRLDVSLETSSISNENEKIFKRPADPPPLKSRKRFVKKPPILPQICSEGTSLNITTPDPQGTSDEETIFKKPIGRAPVKLKRKPEKINPTVPTKKRRRTKQKDKSSKRPHIHTMVIPDPEEIDDDCDDTSQDDDSSSLEFHQGALDDCFIIEANIENESYRCSRTVTFNVNNPEQLLDINETIEHIEVSSKEWKDDMEQLNCQSGASELLEVLSIDATQISTYLQATGAVVIPSNSSDNDSGCYSEDTNSPVLLSKEQPNMQVTEVEVLHRNY